MSVLFLKMAFIATMSSRGHCSFSSNIIYSMLKRTYEEVGVETDTRDRAVLSISEIEEEVQVRSVDNETPNKIAIRDATAGHDMHLPPPGSDG